MIRVTIYNEFIHEQESERIRAVYPQGIHETLRRGLQDETLSIRTVTLGELPVGLSDAVLDAAKPVTIGNYEHISTRQADVTDGQILVFDWNKYRKE